MKLQVLAGKATVVWLLVTVGILSGCTSSVPSPPSGGAEPSTMAVEDPQRVPDDQVATGGGPGEIKPNDYASWVDKADPDLKLPVRNIDDGPYDLGALGVITGKDGDYWVLAECNYNDCEPTRRQTYLVDVRNPYAADLWEGRPVSVRGTDGGEWHGRHIIIVNSDQGILPKDAP